MQDDVEESAKARFPLSQIAFIKPAGAWDTSCDSASASGRPPWSAG